MSGFSMKLIGAQEVVSALNKGTKKPVENNLSKLALKVERNVKMATVVDTGRLRASVGGGSYRGGSYPKGYGIEKGADFARIGTNVEYAEFVEYGTPNMEARHMEGGAKVLGEGMFEYVLRQMQSDLKDFEVKVVKETESEFK